MRTIQFLFGLIIVTIILGCAAVDMTPPPVKFEHDCACHESIKYYAGI